MSSDPLASVVIVSYNRFDATTGPCLESLACDPDAGLLQVIVVDNGSRDGSLEKLKRFACRHNWVEVVENSGNRGYAGGNNDGVARATGDIIVLLNSDTVVPPGALQRLAGHVRDRKHATMVGPVTNQAGNEQKIYTQSQTTAGLFAEGDAWCRHAGPSLYPSGRLDFFCVAMPVDLYRALGGLDETFGRGYYEDTDFSLRAAARGAAMLVAEDVFVLHNAGQSFSTLGADGVKDLMRQNRRRLLKKHPNGVRLCHLRDVNLEIMGRYCNDAEQGGVDPGCGFRFANRMQLAATLSPKNPLKRLRYRLRLSGVRKRFDRITTAG